MSGTYDALPPGQPAIGPVRSPRGLVDVEVSAATVVVRVHDSWRAWFDSEIVLGAVAVVGLVVGATGLVVGGTVGVVLLVAAALLVVPLLVLVVVSYAAMAFVVVQTLVRLVTPAGRARLRRGAAGALEALGEVELGHFPREEVTVLGPVEHGRRARLRLRTPQGELVLTTPRRHHGRLEAVVRALEPR